MARIKQRFKFATTVELESDERASFERLDARLAALPDRRWPAVEVVSHRYTEVPAPTILHLVRLCPQLRDVSFQVLNGEELAAALEGLAPAAGTLQALRLSLKVAEGIEPGAALRVGTALVRLSGLRQLSITEDRVSERGASRQRHHSAPARVSAHAPRQRRRHDA